MTYGELARLKRMMERTFSVSDGEALNAIRAANRILEKSGLTWDRVLSRTVNVIAEFEEAPNDSRV